MAVEPKIVSAIALSVGATALAVGTYLAPPSGVEGLTLLSTVAASTLVNLAPNLFSNVTQDTIKGSCVAIGHRLRNAASKQRLPENHDLARAIRKSHLNALEYILGGLEDAARRDPVAYDAPTIVQFCKRARGWTLNELKNADRSDFFLNIPIEMSLTEVRRLVDSNDTSTSIETLSKLSALAMQSAHEELSVALGCGSTPQAFVDWFEGHAQESASWPIAAQAFFAERLKTDERLRTVVFLDLLNRVLGSVVQLSSRLTEALTVLTRHNGVLAERFDRLQEVVSTLAKRDITFDSHGLQDALIAALTRSDFIEALRRRGGVESPSDAWAASRAVIDVRLRIAELTRQFFGREDELAQLDRFVDTNDRGVAIVAAPAGSGKSALLAHWLNRRRARGDLVVRHFASTRFQGSVEPVEALRHILAQLREIDADDPTQRTPDNEPELLDKLTSRLGHPPRGDERLIIILDGLDELSRTLNDAFVRVTLARGIFLLVSGRAAADETPSYLQQWLNVPLEGVSRQRIDVSGLPIQDVRGWVHEAVGRLDPTEELTIATSLHKTTDGFPLFLRFVIEDFTLRLGQAQTREARTAIMSDLPAPFSQYIARELSRLQGSLGTAWSRSVRRLFAILTCTMGPIRADELEDVFSFNCRGDPAFPNSPVLSALDPRVRRWLSIREVSGIEQLAFAHPRLSIAFHEALGSEGADAEGYLISWMQDAWGSRRTHRGLKFGADYALDWLPEHLECAGADGESQAAILVASPAFLTERLRDPKAASRRLSATLELWNRLDDKSKSSFPEEARQWTSFWAANESALRLATAVSEREGFDTSLPVLRCLGDAGVAGSDKNAQASMAKRAHRMSSAGTLLRSIERAHKGTINGLVPIDDRIVSFGGDGAIRFWTHKGASLKSGSGEAHGGGVNGVLRVGDRIISWGMDCAIRFWTNDGELIEGTGGKAPDRWLEGVLPVGNRFVSWDVDGGIHFWSNEGALLKSIYKRAGFGYKVGVLPLTDRLVIWEQDGTIRFCSHDGAPLRGGGPNAHMDGVKGIIEVGDRLISWGGDRAIRFWTNDGIPLRGGVRNAHEDGEMGLLPVGDRLISWSWDGGIRFWSHDGAPLEGGDRNAHHPSGTMGVLLIGDRLASWGGDGSLRFWSTSGAALEGGGEVGVVNGILPIGNQLVSWGIGGDICFWSCDGSPLRDGGGEANVGYISGILPLGDRLVSWGWNGSVRFWSNEGALIEGGAADAHKGVVNGVLSVGNRLVSWSYDGAIRFWSNDGAPLKGGDSKAHLGGVKGVLPVGNRLVSWGHDGAIRFWSNDGVPLKGGDSKAHLGEIMSVLSVGDRLVSWGHDRAIRFWSHDGTRLEGGVKNAHEGIWGLLPVGDHLASWGCDGDYGSVRFWTRDGGALKGGAKNAHRWNVGGILDLEDRLVSWGRDEGTIRFWSRNGAPIKGGGKAHERGIVDILSTGDRLVSWGRDGRICFWTRNGAPVNGGYRAAHKGGVFGVAAVGDRLVSWGKDAAIRFWSPDGAPIGVGQGDAHKDHYDEIFFWVQPIGNRLVSWGIEDNTIRLWSSGGVAQSILVPPGGFSDILIRNTDIIVTHDTVWVYSLNSL